MTQPHAIFDEDLAAPPSEPPAPVDESRHLEVSTEPHAVSSNVAPPDGIPPHTPTDDDDICSSPNEAEPHQPDPAEAGHTDENGRPKDEQEPADADTPHDEDQPLQSEPEIIAPPEPDFTKVVIYLQATTTIISVQRNATDPRWLTTNDTDINQALARVPAFLEQAEQQWAVGPMYHKLPPEPKATPAPTPPRSTPHPPEKNTSQSPMLL